MKTLVFRYRLRTIVLGFISVLLLIAIALDFILSARTNVRPDWKSIVLILVWIVVLYLSMIRSRISSGENCLKIRWTNMFLEVTVPDEEIEKIVLGKQYVAIVRKRKKPLRLTLESMEKEDKTRLYEFLIEYSKQKNLGMERQYNL